MIAFYDTECFPNYWLLKFKLETGLIFSFALQDGQRFTLDQKRSILRIFDLFTTVSFNGNYYDVPMICAALNDFDPVALKMLNDKIIVEGAKPWELNLPEWKPADHIDVMEVAPGAGGLKQYAARIHSKTIQDLPYDPGTFLTPEQIVEVDLYCGNDLTILEDLFVALYPQLQQREALGARYGLDLRSKSDAQLAETVLKRRCEEAAGRRIFKPDIDWYMRFNYRVPDYIGYTFPQLQRALEIVRRATFAIRPPASMRLEGFDVGKCIAMPPELEGLEIKINNTTYKLGIGGLHSQEKVAVHISDEHCVLHDNDVAAYYPSLILNSGSWPPAMGETFLREYGAIKAERLSAKELEGKLKKAGDTSSPQYVEAHVGNEGGKIMINGTFGKTGSPYSVLFAPEMLIQTTITGQLSLLMLIDWHEYYGIPIVSANTDGIVVKCPRDKLETSRALIAAWQERTGLEMETVEYRAIYSRDVNNYFAIKADGSVKRKGEYSKAGLIEKKNPDVEICSDAVAEFLSKGTPIASTILNCTDIRKFVTIQKVNGGGVKMWGHGPRKDDKVRDMIPVLELNGWTKEGRKWRKGEIVTDPTTAYKSCFLPQRPEYLGKVVRWYYGTQSPGPIVYASNGNTVSLSYGARPCMTLPDTFPSDIDYEWYIRKADDILHDIGFYTLQ